MDGVNSSDPIHRRHLASSESHRNVWHVGVRILAQASDAVALQPRWGAATEPCAPDCISGLHYIQAHYMRVLHTCCITMYGEQITIPCTIFRATSILSNFQAQDVSEHMHIPQESHSTSHTPPHCCLAKDCVILCITDISVRSQMCINQRHPHPLCCKALLMMIGFCSSAEV